MKLLGVFLSLSLVTAGLSIACSAPDPAPAPAAKDDAIAKTPEASKGTATKAPAAKTTSDASAPPQGNGCEAQCNAKFPGYAPIEAADKACFDKCGQGDATCQQACEDKFNAACKAATNVCDGWFACVDACDPPVGTDGGVGEDP